MALVPVEAFVQEGRDAVLNRVQLPYWGVRVFNDLLRIPFMVLGMAPMVLALTDALHNDRARRTWVERACLGLGLTGFVGVRLRYYSQLLLNQPGTGSHIPITIDLVELIVAM